MDLLAIETFPWTPHLETAAEVCITEAEVGRSVGFAFIHVDNPDLGEPSLRGRIRGENPKNKVARLMRLLRSQGVTSIETPELPAATRRLAREFATQHIVRIATIDDVRRLLYKDAPLGIGIASSLIHHTQDPLPDVTRLRGLIARYLSASATVFESAFALIREYRPKTVLAFNGRFACTKPIVEAARQLEAECLLHERGATVERYIVRRGSLHDFALDRRCIAEMWAQAPAERAEVGRSFFARRRQGDGIGWQSFTGRQRQGFVSPRRHSRRIVYFSSCNDEYASVDARPDTCFDSQRHAIEFLVEWTRDQPDAELVIRLHPNLQGKPDSDPRYWESLREQNVIIEGPESETDSYALAESADLVVTYGSTMGVEAAFLGKPVLLLCDSRYSGLDIVYEPKTPEEVVALLCQSALPPKPIENCLPYGYYALTFGTPYRFYQPKSLFEGSLMGITLTMDHDYWLRFRKSSVGQCLIKARDRVRGS